MNERTNTTVQPKDQPESTYALLIRSQKKSRNVLEVAIYPLLSLGPLIAIWQFVQQPVSIPPDRPPHIVFDPRAKNHVCRDEFHTLRWGQHSEIKG